MTNVVYSASGRNALEGFDQRLTPAGAIIYKRTRRPPSTCNLLARLAGLGTVEG